MLLVLYLHNHFFYRFRRRVVLFGRPKRSEQFLKCQETLETLFCITGEYCEARGGTKYCAATSHDKKDYSNLPNGGDSSTSAPQGGSDRYR